MGSVERTTRGRVRHCAGPATEARSRAQSMDDVAAETFRVVAGAPDYPCVGARSVLRRGRAEVHGYAELGAPSSARALLGHLTRFGDSVDLAEGFASFVAVFLHDPHADEASFEALLWRQLQDVHDIDPAAADPAVSADPTSPDFGFSVAGTAYFVLGLHPAASRAARRSPLPMVVFNLHRQFDQLRAAGRYERMRDTIRRRDADVNGSVNPMVADHGESSEAAQYSGRYVPPSWRAPFSP